MSDIAFARNPENGIDSLTLATHFKGLGFKVKKLDYGVARNSEEYSGYIFSPKTGTAYYQSTVLTLTKDQTIIIAEGRDKTDYTKTYWLVFSNFNYDLSQLFPPIISTIYKNKRFTFNRVELGNSFGALERWETDYDYTNHKYIKKRRIGTINPPVKSLEVTYDKGGGPEQLTATVTREEIMQLPVYSKILDLGLKDYSSRIQIKNETFYFGFPKINVRVGSNFTSQWSTDWLFDTKGRYKDTFQISKNGSVRRLPLGSQDRTIKKLKSPFELKDWENMFDVLYNYLVGTQIPDMEKRGLHIFKTEQDRYDNRDIIALDTMFEKINKFDISVKTFEEFDSVVSITIPFIKGGPLGWSVTTKTFSGEISELYQVCPQLKSSLPGIVYVKDEISGKTVKYKYTKTDYDGSGEDIYGYHFESQDGKFKSYLLIIND